MAGITGVRGNSAVGWGGVKEWGVNSGGVVNLQEPTFTP